MKPDTATAPLTDRVIAAAAANPVATDVALSAAVALIGTLGALSFDTGRPLGLALTGACAAALLVRRRHPGVALGVTAVALATSAVVGTEASAEFVAFGVALYSMGAFGGPRRSVAKAFAVVLAGAALTLAPAPALEDREALAPLDLLAGVLLLVGFFGAMWMIGEAVRRRREIEVELRAANRALRDEQERAAERAVMDERVRIARELHDVVAHHVSVMGLQAGAARVALRAHPDRAEAALGEIERSSRQTVDELRRLLGFLRRDEPDDDAPQPSLADVDRLVDDLRRAGRTVHLERSELPDLVPSVGLSVYRIVQESLTNAVKHGTAGRIRVEIGTVDDLPGAEPSVEVTVRSSGNGDRPPTNDLWSPVPADAVGHGIRGMRERAAFHGGTLETRSATGWFEVRARLPIDGEPQRVSR